MRYTNFDEANFRADVDQALKSVDRILEVHRKPRLAEDTDHSYGDKYELANTMTNISVIAQMTCLERMGLTKEILQGLLKTNTTHTTTLRFQATESSTFIKETQVKIPMERTVETVEDTQTNSSSFFGSTTKATVSRMVRKVKEFHWKVNASWEISAYSGTNVKERTILQKRDSATIVVIQSRKIPPVDAHKEHAPIEVSLTWLLQQIDATDLASQFKIDTTHVEAKTPLRNKDVEGALEFGGNLETWATDVRDYFSAFQQDILYKHNPAAGPPPEKTLSLNNYNKLCQGVFNPIIPVMEDGRKEEEKPRLAGLDIAVGRRSMLCLRGINEEEETHNISPLLSGSDLSKLVAEHCRSLDEKMRSLPQSFTAKHSISAIEAGIVLLCDHLEHLQDMYFNSMGYIEWMLEQQLVAAIGKRVDSTDLDKFVKFHNKKILQPAPKPFCHSIRRPNHYPDGVLSIEAIVDGKKEPIETFVREVKMPTSLKMPLDAAASVELTGKTFLHGWLQHRFADTHQKYELIARARQFSSFMLVVGTMTGPDELDPKDAIILQNKDEVIIPLLLNELPSGKEFKDAIQSLSPEQQRFAKSFRSMQLGSSVLGVCIIQVKPQLETLLGLPPGALTKEMKLTQDLMQLFIEFQVPSDLLSYDGEDECAGVRDKVEHVKAHVAAVMDVINAAKQKQLTQAADMALMKQMQDFPSLPSAASNATDDSLINFQSLSCSVEYDAVSASYSMPSWRKMMKKKTKSRAQPRPPPAAMAPPPPPAAMAPPPIRPDGFHSGSANYGLMQKYGAPPPTQRAGSGSPAFMCRTLSLQDKTADSLANTKNMLCASKEVGVSTLEELERQRQVLASIVVEADGGEYDWSVPKSDFEQNAPDYDWSADKPAGGHPVQLQLESGTRDNIQAGQSDEGPSDQQNAKQTDEVGNEVVDFTLMPKKLDEIIETHDKDGALCSTVIETENSWTRHRQETLLSKVATENIGSQEIKTERNKTFDLLDAMSRSGSLPIACSELHVIICLTHRFEKDVMGTVIVDNVNPIEKLEISTLLFASTVHGVQPKDLIREQHDAERLARSFPRLLA